MYSRCGKLIPEIVSVIQPCLYLLPLECGVFFNIFCSKVRIYFPLLESRPALCLDVVTQQGATFSLGIGECMCISVWSLWHLYVNLLARLASWVVVEEGPSVPEEAVLDQLPPNMWQPNPAEPLIMCSWPPTHGEGQLNWELSNAFRILWI